MIKILWITNIMLPPISEALGIQGQPIGGWMISSLNTLAASDEFELAVATVWNRKERVEKVVGNVRYFLLPSNGVLATQYNKSLEPHWREIKDSYRPDVVHIHGSEFAFGESYINANGNDNVVVSIQGLVSVYTRYYLAGLKQEKRLYNFTLRDFLKGEWGNYGLKRFARNGRREARFFPKVKYIIGRTQWDKAHARALNPDARYFHVGETLRKPFYSARWSYDKCVPHTIFVSQGSYPIKGLHKLIEAMPLVLKRFPDARIIVSGSDPTSQNPLHQTGYGKYLKTQIANCNMIDKISFTGMLNETQMLNEYLKANLYVCPSSIENSPNSLGEAQMLGMPHIATFVGGIPEIVGMDHSVLYRFEETEMLASKICDIFSAAESIVVPNADASRYDAALNAGQLSDVYKTLSAK